jgi:hypothetical protein
MKKSFVRSDKEGTGVHAEGGSGGVSRAAAVQEMQPLLVKVDPREAAHEAAERDASAQVTYDKYMTSIWQVYDNYVTSIWRVCDNYVTSIWREAADEAAQRETSAQITGILLPEMLLQTNELNK